VSSLRLNGIEKAILASMGGSWRDHFADHRRRYRGGTETRLVTISMKERYCCLACSSNGSHLYFPYLLALMEKLSAAKD